MNFVNISEQKRKLARRAAWHLVRDKCSGVDVAMRYLDVTQRIRYKMEDIARWQGDMDSRGTQEQYPTSKRPLAHKWICREFATRWQNPYLLLFQWFLLPEWIDKQQEEQPSLKDTGACKRASESMIVYLEFLNLSDSKRFQTIQSDR